MNSSPVCNRPKRIAFLADFTYAAAKSIASGVIQSLSAQPDLELLILGAHPDNFDTAYPPDERIDGIITCLGTNTPFALKLFRQHEPCPIVFTCSRCDDVKIRERSAIIECDQKSIARAAAKLLLQHGLVNFGYVGARRVLSQSSWDQERRNAFRREINSAGFMLDAYMPPTEASTLDDDFNALSAYLKSLPKPCGVFASYDHRALHVISACQATGIRIPDQIQLISADNEEWICEHTAPTLSSIFPDFVHCGHLAAQALRRMLNGSHPGKPMKFGVRDVVERLSTADLHGYRNRAVRAREHLRTHLGDPLNCEELATRLGCSLRMLQLSYQATFGCSMKDDCKRMRIERVKCLLQESDRPASQLAKAVGLNSPCYLARLFKQETGVTMKRYRRILAESGYV